MSAGHDDDPLARLAAEEDWRDRVRAVERDAAKARRRSRLRVVRPRRQATSRPRNPHRSISWIFFALLGLVAASGVALWTDFGPTQLMVFLFVLATWLVALCLHEFSHALTAHHSGDDTVAEKGYLRLDLRRYGHPLLTFGLPILFLILGGLPLPGGAVMIESHRLRNRFRDALVSAAGPAVNVVLAAGFLAIVSIAGPDGIFLSTPQVAFWSALSFAAWLQVATAILNLIPMPGLDGYGIMEPYLSGSVRHAGRRIAPFGILILIVLLYLPPVGYAFNAACDFFVTLSGAPLNAVDYGAFLFKFWRSWGR